MWGERRILLVFVAFFFTSCFVWKHGASSSPSYIAKLIDLLAPTHPCAGLMGSEKACAPGRLTEDKTDLIFFKLLGGLSQQFSLLSPWKLCTAPYAANQGLVEGLQRGGGSGVPVGVDLPCGC